MTLLFNALMYLQFKPREASNMHKHCQCTIYMQQLKTNRITFFVYLKKCLKSFLKKIFVTPHYC